MTPQLAPSRGQPIAACHSGTCCSAFRQCHDVVCGVAECDELFAARQYDRIEKLLIPRHGLGLVAAAVNLSVRQG